MIRKRWRYLLCAAVIGLAVTGCGKKAEPSKEAQSEISTDMEDTTETQPEKDGETAVETGTAAEMQSASENTDAKEEMYEDNFTVPERVVEEFANTVKAAVADQDLDAFASLLSYPCYVGFKEEGLSVTSKEEMVELGKERIFTPELTEAVAAADDFSPSQAGFVLTKDGKPNIIFGVSEGKLAVRGINY